MKAGFLNKLVTEWDEPWAEGYNQLTAMRLTQSLHYYSEITEHEYIVPAGFRFDGASVPKGLRWAVPRYNETIYAAVVHDYLIRTGVVSDLEADNIFYEALRVSGVGWYHAYKMWLAVRIGSAVRGFERLIGHEGWVLDRVDKHFLTKSFDLTNLTDLAQYTRVKDDVRNNRADVLQEVETGDVVYLKWKPIEPENVIKTAA